MGDLLAKQQDRIDMFAKATKLHVPDFDLVLSKGVDELQIAKVTHRWMLHPLTSVVYGPRCSTATEGPRHQPLFG